MKGGVTSALGFLANGARCGIKKSRRADLGLVYSHVPAVAAAAFTTNVFAASPVIVSRHHLRSKTHQAVIVNSGNANCANGPRGEADAERMANAAARALSLPEEAVLVASTGIIGRPLPVERIGRALPALIEGLSRAGGQDFADAIMTTDTVRKEACAKARIGKATVTIGGAAKGVGMIYPDLKVAPHATMLCFLTTDACISRDMLERALSGAVDTSFNMISVDGDMSTNDTVFILANGLAGNARITGEGKGYRAFADALGAVTRALAKAIVADGEGATKMIEVAVRGARTMDDARRVARKVTTSNLFKSAAYGEDPNWGRIVAAAGASGIEIDPRRVSVDIGRTKVFARGAARHGADKGALRKVFAGRQIPIRIDLGSGACEAVAWTSDLSEEYVRINAAYST